MAETHVISALRAKRAEVSGYIHDLEKKVKRIRANLAHIDATIRVSTWMQAKILSFRLRQRLSLLRSMRKASLLK
jgi:hypothetical protein